MNLSFLLVVVAAADRHHLCWLLAVLVVLVLVYLQPKKHKWTMFAFPDEYRISAIEQNKSNRLAIVVILIGFAFAYFCVIVK